MPTIAKLAPKILPPLGFAAVSGAISGSTHRAMTGAGAPDARIAANSAVAAVAKQHTRRRARRAAYMQHGLTLSMGQKENLAKAVGDGTLVTLRLSSDALDDPDMLMLTKT